MKNKISFIIPAYNSENYIKNCLDNICNDIDDEKDVEIIVVENGSTDKTKEVVSDYIKESNYEIKLFSSKKGVSNARNMGIKESSGNYIVFVDSDDVWLKGSLKEIKKDIKNNYDLILYSFIKGTFSMSFDKCEKIIHNIDNNINIDEKKVWMISKPTFRMQVWNKVFSSKIIKENELYFNDELTYSEDSEFVIRYLNKSKKIFVSSYPIYKYVLSENSLMRSVNKKRVDGYLKSLECSNREIINESDKFKYAFFKYVLCHLNIMLVHDVFISRKGISYFKDKKYLKKILSNEIIKKSLKNIKLKDCLSVQLLPEFFMKLKMYFMASLFCYLKSYLNNKK